MPVELKFAAESGALAAVEVLNFIKVMKASAETVAAIAPKPVEKQPSAAASAKADDEKEDKVEKPKKEKPKKEKPAEPEAPAPEPVVVPPVDDEEVPVTLDGCRKIVRRVMETDGTSDGSKGGLKLAHSIVLKFGVATVTTLPAEKYEDFIKECKKALAERKNAAPAVPTDPSKLF